MKSALVDVPVLILFFNRPQQLSQVFEQVKKARPSQLFPLSGRSTKRARFARNRSLP